uniref:glucan endo-1,3-beta-D-glucosidase n=1 Tax=Albugo laibachii Nc14 TaxID=890382 RepID=F0WCX6_9STRA|nr:endo1 putative [Albugo laibachii Nc14]|eukprot:CCA19047.1 endo1 putative [Albugo laibachii Nc14]
MSTSPNNRETTPLLRARGWQARMSKSFILPLVVALVIVVSIYVSLRPSSKIAQSLPPITQLPTNSLDRSLPPFSLAKHKIPPKLIDRRRFPQAIPTNSFWSNLLVGDSHGLNVGSGEITLSPFTVRNLPQRLEISYGDTRRVVTNVSIFEVFHMDVGITGFRNVMEPGNKSIASESTRHATSREIVAFDALSVTVRYGFDVMESVITDTAPFIPPFQCMNVSLSRGAPYLTVRYHEVVPVLEFNGTIVRLNGQEIKDPLKPTQWTGRKFVIQALVYGATNGLAVPQKWILYFENARTLSLVSLNKISESTPYNQDGSLTTPTQARLIDSSLYSGVLRVTVVADDVMEPVLDQYAHIYPKSAKIDISAQEEKGFVGFSWDTDSFQPISIMKKGVNASSDLLMMANPHQVMTFSEMHITSNVFEVLDIKTGYRTLKSNMTAVVGRTWVLEENMTDIGFGMHQDIHLDFIPLHKDAIRESLYNDSKYVPKAEDPYFFGKEVNRQAKLVLIANALNESSVRDAILDQLQVWMTTWLTGSNSDPFVYDSVWGGICSQNGLDGIFWMTDFGNGWYNDHHFHYGYFLNTLAIILKFRPSYFKLHEAAIFSLVRDIANPEQEDPYFPFARHFSWFDGHSFASGMYTLDGGKSQESVSEAINAYYGVYLLGLALNMTSLTVMGQVLLSMEARAAEVYWQMPSWSTIYEPVYAANKMSGQIACTKVQYSTWFGPKPEHMHLINMIPFTPASTLFLKRRYIAEEYQVLLDQALRRPNYSVEELWKGYATLALALLDPSAAWDQLQQIQTFDDGNSRTNSLYWIAVQNH